MDIYVYCMLKKDYDSFINAIWIILENLLGKKIRHEREKYGKDNLHCSFFSMYIELESEMEFDDLSFTEEEYGIAVNTYLFINVFDGVYYQGVHLLQELITSLGDDYYDSIIVAGHCSQAVYLKSRTINYIEKDFWTKEHWEKPF